MTAYSLHPGIIFTPLYQHSYSLESLKGRVVQTMLYPFSKSVPQVCPGSPEVMFLLCILRWYQLAPHTCKASRYHIIGGAQPVVFITSRNHPA